MYIGVNNITRQITNCYVGVNGVARKVKAVYVGVNEKAKLVWEAIKKKLSALISTVTVSAVNDSLLIREVQCVYKNNNNHVLVGTSVSTNSDGVYDLYLYNCKLDDNGNVTSYTRYCPDGAQFSNWTCTLESINKFNDTYGVCVYSSVNDGTTTNNTRYVEIFNLNNSSSRVSNILIGSGSLDRIMPIVKLNYNTVLVPTYSTGGYVYGRFIKCDNETLSSPKSMTLTNNPSPSSYAVIMNDRCVAFPLSNNRFVVFTTIKQQYVSDPQMKLLANIYSYSYDSSGNFIVTSVADHVLSYIYITNVIEMDDDYFVGISASAATGFYINSNNGIVLSNTVSNANGFSASRIGTSDSIYGTWYNKYSIVYYNKNSNIIEITSTGTRENRDNKLVSYNDQDVLEVLNYGGVITFNKTAFS